MFFSLNLLCFACLLDAKQENTITMHITRTSQVKWPSKKQQQQHHLSLSTRIVLNRACLTRSDKDLNGELVSESNLHHAKKQSAHHIELHLGEVARQILPRKKCLFVVIVSFWLNLLV